MDLYNLSEQLVQGLESQIQQETNDSYKSQYQQLLQNQKNTSASLKSLSEASNQAQQTANQTQQSQTGADTEFASENYMNAKNLTQAQRNASANQFKESYGTNDPSQDASK